MLLMSEKQLSDLKKFRLRYDFVFLCSVWNTSSTSPVVFENFFFKFFGADGRIRRTHTGGQKDLAQIWHDA